MAPAATEEVAELVSRQKALSAEIGRAKRAGDDADTLIAEHAEVSRRITEIGQATQTEDDADGGGADDLTVQIVEDESAFTAMRDDWHALEEASDNFSVFMSWEWMHTWWEVFGRGKRLHIITVRDAQDRLVGLLPLMRVRPRWSLGAGEYLAFVGTGERPKSDYLGLMIERGQRGRVADLLADALKGQVGRIGMALLAGVASDGHADAGVFDVAQTSGLSVLATGEGVTVHGPLPGSFQEFLSAVPSQTRRNRLRRCAEELDQRFDDVLYARSETPEQVSQAVSELSRMSVARFGRGALGSAWANSAFCEFLKEVATSLQARGALHLARLMIGGGCVSALLGWAYNGTFFCYQLASDRAVARWEPGHCLVRHTIAELMGSSIRRFDFGRGLDPYKTGYFAGRTRLVTFLMAPDAPASLRRAGWWMLGRSVVRDARRILKRQ